ncbi:glycyl-radical enzyme activating protein [candidate division KSB3 bacterium]|uniref:Glycyl-radical enzyme activating protein n=1 Tax=candidate division KSB3 bacterium TaxID=2044937 RepID=A0A9D5Q706_9BACT|nr:glycyl-radical enzyme activating protein [candidate division KSB3 bacterium]MBD3325797.1 glycyl-radical enzyme activating protein [candidate division KSB3 bacterium]
MGKADTPYVFNIQKFSLHDGPGIRTLVFLKGCHLRCPWCSNPEGLSPHKELAYVARLCTHCLRCEQTCPQQAIRWNGTSITIDREQCIQCGACVEQCEGDALTIYGQEYSVDDVLADVIKDQVFFKRSNGGLTVSGGDPFYQYDFTYALVKKAKTEHHLNTAIETACYVREDQLRQIVPYLDWVLCDIKIIDPVRHKAVTGVSNDLILKNIRILVNEYSEDSKVLLRFPLIPSLTDDQANIDAIADFLRSLDREVPLEILPYHRYGASKYASLEKEYAVENIAEPDKQQVERAVALFAAKGITVIHT